MDCINKGLLEKYFSGSCAPEEQLAVEKHLKEAGVQQLDAYINDVEEQISGEEVPETVITEELQALHAKIAPTRVRTIFSFRKLVAASVAAIVFISASIWLTRTEHKKALWVSIGNDSHGLRFVRLEDGTQVWLNIHSQLEYDRSVYNNAKREVKVRGEAYFDVAHNPEKPFIVHAGNLTTTVKGTAFNVEAYEKEQDVRVTLVRGKVAVNAGGREYMMTPGERVSYDTKRNNMDVTKVATQAITQWMNGSLVFDDLPLADVLLRLENYYNVRIRCEDKSVLEGKRIRGQYQYKTAEEVLHKILFIHGLKVKTQGGKYVIQK